MKIRQKGKQFEISYRCPGYTKIISERFPTYEAAKLRVAEIEYEKGIGQLRPPRMSLESERSKPAKKYLTVSELMDEYVQLYGLNHWGDSFLSCSRHRIEDYIKPYIGKMLLQDITTHELDLFYNKLLEQPAVTQKGRKNVKTVSPQVIDKVHALLRGAFNQAVKWGYMQNNPAMNATLPEYEKNARQVWTLNEAQEAVKLCENPVLRIAMLLAIGCSMRIGEILGLTWDNVSMTDESIQDGTACITIDRELKRCDKRSLEDLEKRGRSKVYFMFPEVKQKSSCTTVLALKAPKTVSSIRNVYLPATVAKALQEQKERQEQEKALLGAAYTDFGLVVTHEDGRPYEERQIADLLRRFTKTHGLPPVVFHSLRHCSTSMKLQLSGGDIKAVQGDTGHAQARMVTDLYAHINTEDRRQLAKKVEQDFFQKGSPEKKEKAAEDTAREAYQLLLEKPEIAKLVLALGNRSSAS